MKNSHTVDGRMIHIISGLGAYNFEVNKYGQIYACLPNQKTPFCINDGNTETTYNLNIQNLKNLYPDLDYSENENVPEENRGDVLCHVIANIREAGVTPEMVENLKAANKELKFANRSGERSVAISLAMALNEGLVNFAANQQTMGNEEPVDDVVFEDDGMEKDFNN